MCVVLPGLAVGGSKTAHFVLPAALKWSTKHTPATCGYHCLSGVSLKHPRSMVFMTLLMTLFLLRSLRPGSCAGNWIVNDSIHLCPGG